MKVGAGAETKSFGSTTLFLSISDNNCMWCLRPITIRSDDSPRVPKAITIRNNNFLRAKSDNYKITFLRSVEVLRRKQKRKVFFYRYNPIVFKVLVSEFFLIC